jgi:hypothetical protein
MTNFTYAAVSESNIYGMSAVYSSLSGRLLTSNLSWILIVFRRFFTWIALGNVRIYLRFSLTLERRANAVEEETKWTARLYHHRNQSTHVTDSVTVTSLTAGLLQMTRAAKNSICQIALNRKLLRKFEKWCEFSSRIKAKSLKKKSRKTRPACINFFLRILKSQFTNSLHHYIMCQNSYSKSN